MVKIRRVKENDLHDIYNLYVDVTTAHPSKMTQNNSEITLEYIKNEVIDKSIKYGLMLVAENEKGKVSGIFKGYTSPYRSLAHVMTNATLMSDPNEASHTRTFVMLWNEFFKIVKKEYRHIYKFETAPHSSNKVAIKFYLSHGLKTDVILKDKIFNIETGDFEDEIIMSWVNPNFDMEELKKYHSYLLEYIKQ